MRDVTFIISNSIKEQYSLIKNFNDSFSDYFKKIDFIFIEDFNTPSYILYNIAIRYCATEYIGLIDENIRVLNRFNPIKIYDNTKFPFIAFNKLSIDDADIDANKIFGLFLFMKRNDFNKYNGFSNLCVDNEFNCKIFNFKIGGLCRLKNKLIYIDKLAHNEENYDFSLNIYNMYHMKQIKPEQDGLLQTTYNLISKIKKKHIINIKVDNVNIVDDYKYLDLYNQSKNK